MSSNRTEYHKSYYQQNREKILAQRKAYRAAHPLCNVWINMMQRCGLHKGADPYKLSRYAARGVTVCPEWRHFKPFETWALANGWKKGLQLDRIDNDGPYSPENCRFVTPSQNSRNRRSTVMFGGKPLADWYDTMGHTEGLNHLTFLWRFRRGWPICRALFEPVHQTNHPNPKANSQPR